MLEDMTTLSDALRERLNDVESEISLVKTVVIGSAHGIDVSHKLKVPEPKSLVVHEAPKSWRTFSGIWSSISSLHIFWMVRKS